MQAATTLLGDAFPIVKWAGGKRSLLDRLFAHVPEKIDRYYEPFAGGAALFFALQAVGRFKKASLNDTNRRLITTYTAVRDDVESVIRRLRRMPNDEAFFFKQRAKNVDKLDPAAQAAWLIYLNRTCFNGLYRVNAKNEFNVSFGHYKNPLICDADNLRAASLALTAVELCCEDFGTMMLMPHAGDFVYFDPPFLTRVGNEFVRYGKGVFGRDDHERLAACARDLKQRGVNVLISNSDTDEVREIFHGFDFEEVRGRRSVNRDGNGRAPAPDLLIW